MPGYVASSVNGNGGKRDRPSWTSAHWHHFRLSRRDSSRKIRCAWRDLCHNCITQFACICNHRRPNELMHFFIVFVSVVIGIIACGVVAHKSCIICFRQTKAIAITMPIACCKRLHLRGTDHRSRGNPIWLHGVPFQGMRIPHENDFPLYSFSRMAVVRAAGEEQPILE